MTFEKEIIKRVKEAAEGIGIDTVAELQRSVPVATGFLRSNIDYNIKEVSGNVIISITMPQYAEYVEFGRPPNIDVPTLKDIEEWCKVKGIDKKFVFPIWKHILEHGTRPQPFIRPYINTKLQDVITKNIARVLK